MTVYYDWQQCECNFYVFFTLMQWSEKKEKSYDCFFNRETGQVQVDANQMPDNKTVDEVTPEDILTCFALTERKLRDEICGKGK